MVTRKRLDVEAAREWKARIETFAMAINAAGLGILGDDHPETGYECIDGSISMVLVNAAKVQQQIGQVAEHIGLHLADPDAPDTVAELKEKLRESLAQAGIDVKDIELGQDGPVILARAEARRGKGETDTAVARSTRTYEFAVKRRETHD